jgi:glycerophosphoryl diester phosphodiesterase
MRRSFIVGAVALPLLSAGTAQAAEEPVHLGPRPFYLVDKMDEGQLKDRLLACDAGSMKRTDWSIGHRGAALQFPEHTEESYRAAARMGAGIVECDVTFTRDRQLVCRHAQDDLHTTTNILATDLASTCVESFTPASGEDRASAKCTTADITLDEFKSLEAKMDAADRSATTVGDYINATAGWRTDLYVPDGTLMSHAESIALLKALGVKMTPELKAPAVPMPFEGDYTQEIYAQQMIDEYKAAAVDPADVFPQSFSLDDVLYWIEAEPEFGKQAVWLDGSAFGNDEFDPMDASTWPNAMAELKAMGINYISPPIWYLVSIDDGAIVPSEYAIQARAAGLEIIAWTAERSGHLSGGGGWFYQTVGDLIDDEGDIYSVLDVLRRDIGVAGVFSDWPATTTFFANCVE